MDLAFAYCLCKYLHAYAICTGIHFDGLASLVMRVDVCASCWLLVCVTCFLAFLLRESAE